MIVSIGGPQWFFKIDSVFQIIFALVTLAITIYSYKAFHFAKERRFKYFSAAFLLLGIGFLVLSISNLLIYLGLYDGILSRWGELNVANAVYMVHILFMLTGYMLMIIISMHLEKRRLVALLMAITFLFVLFSYKTDAPNFNAVSFVKFHIVSLIFLSFVAWQFHENYAQKKSVNAGLVFASFYTLAVAELFFSMVRVMNLFYVIGYILQLVGYSLLFAMFVRVVNYGRTKKQA